MWLCQRHVHRACVLQGLGVIPARRDFDAPLAPGARPRLAAAAPPPVAFRPQCSLSSFISSKLEGLEDEAALAGAGEAAGRERSGVLLADAVAALARAAAESGVLRPAAHAGEQPLPTQRALEATWADAAATVARSRVARAAAREVLGCGSLDDSCGGSSGSSSDCSPGSARFTEAESDSGNCVGSDCDEPCGVAHSEAGAAAWPRRQPPAAAEDLMTRDALARECAIALVESRRLRQSLALVFVCRCDDGGLDGSRESGDSSCSIEAAAPDAGAAATPPDAWATAAEAREALRGLIVASRRLVDELVEAEHD